MVYLVHHAAALEADVDPQRPLAPAGREHAQRLAADAAARGVRPAVGWHSGKLRARQTAEAFWRVCNPFAEVAAARGLQPTDPPQWAHELIAREARDIMLVGHMPHLPRLYTLLVAGIVAVGPVDFPLHGMVALEPHAERWRELWRLPLP